MNGDEPNRTPHSTMIAATTTTRAPDAHDARADNVQVGVVVPPAPRRPSSAGGGGGGGGDAPSRKGSDPDAVAVAANAVKNNDEDDQKDQNDNDEDGPSGGGEDGDSAEEGARSAPPAAVPPPPWRRSRSELFHEIRTGLSSWQRPKCAPSSSIDLRDAETVFSVRGNVPLVLAVPHGGDARPPDIPNRTSGCTEPDTHTAQLGWSVFVHAVRLLNADNKNRDDDDDDDDDDDMEEEDGDADEEVDASEEVDEEEEEEEEEEDRKKKAGTKYENRRHSSWRIPYLVMGKVHRIKVDLARGRKCCCENNHSAGRRVWDDYHGAIQRFLDDAIAAGSQDGGCSGRNGSSSGNGTTAAGVHLFDLHGQCHRDATEVGHMLTNRELRAVLLRAGADASTATATTKDDADDLYMTRLGDTRSSISAMRSLPTFTDYPDVLIGPHSIGTLLSNYGATDSSRSTGGSNSNDGGGYDRYYAAVPSQNIPYPCYGNACENDDPAVAQRQQFHPQGPSSQQPQPLQQQQRQQPQQQQLQQPQPKPCCRGRRNDSSNSSNSNSNSSNHPDSGAACCVRSRRQCRRPCSGFDVCQWKGGCGGNENSGDRCEFGPCSFFWGANTLAMYGGGRRCCADPNRGGGGGDDDKTMSSSQITKYRGRVAATQLETQWRRCRENAQQIERFGTALATAILQFMDHYYNINSIETNNP